MKKIIQRLKEFILILWVVVVVFSLPYYLNGGYVEADDVVNFLKEFHSFGIIVYLLISIFRSFTLIPSTPFILIGAMLFSPNVVFVVGLTGVLLSSTIVYYFSEFLGFDSYFDKKYPKKTKQLHALIEKHGFFIVMGWTFCPFVPTDLICYAAGTLRMTYWKFFLGVLLGELPIILLTTYVGAEIPQLLDQLDELIKAAIT